MGSSVTGREKFSIELKSVRQKIQRRLMKMCGGSGKNATIPPREYIPHSFVVDDIKCGKCLKIYKTGNDVKMHVLDEHKRGVKRLFNGGVGNGCFGSELYGMAGGISVITGNK